MRGHFSPVKAFSRRNTCCISRGNNDEWRKIDPKLGVLIFFKQALPASSSFARHQALPQSLSLLNEKYPVAHCLAFQMVRL
jgi:hypothetical protein